MTRADFEEWLLAQLAEIMRVAPGEVDDQAHFEELGLDSANALVLAGKLRELTGLRIDPDTAYLYPTVAELAEHLAGLSAEGVR